MPERRCARCGHLKRVSDFNWKDKQRSRLQAYCRGCMNSAWREWYSREENRVRHILQVAERRRRRSRLHREIVAHFKSQPCADCGGTFPPWAMDFDHVAQKTGEVSKFVYTYGTERLLAEIRNCDVVCSNCHRERTYRRLTDQTSGIE
jgi:hypothetical protein